MEEEKNFWVSVSYCGALLRTPGNQKYGVHTEHIIPVVCKEEDLATITRAIGKGFLGDCYVAYDNPICDRHTGPYLVVKDCM